MKQMQLTGAFLVVFFLLFFSTVRADTLELSELSLQVKQNNRVMLGKTSFLSFADCFLSLCSGTPNTGRITIQNNSAQEVTNIRVQIPAGWDLTQENSTCLSVGAGGTCFIDLTVTSAVPRPRTRLAIFGDQTQTVYFEIELNDPLNC